MATINDNLTKEAQQAVNLGYVPDVATYVNAVNAGRKSSGATIDAPNISTPQISVPTPKEKTASQLGLTLGSLTPTDTKALENVSGYIPADQVSPLEQSSNDLLTKVLKGFEKLTGKSAFVKSETESAGLADKQKEITRLDNELKAEQNRLINAKAELEKNPEGKLTRNINAQIQQVEKDSYRKQADIAILKSAAQADYTTAQSIIDQKVQLEFGEVEDQINLAQQYLNLIQPTLNREEKKKADAQALFLEERSRLLNEDKAKATQAYNVVMQVSEKNPALAQQLLGQINSGNYDAVISQGISSGAFVSTAGTGATINVLDAQRYNEAYPGANIVPGMTEAEANSIISNMQSQTPEQKISTEISNLKTSGYTKAEAISSVNAEVTDPVIKRKALAEIEAQYGAEAKKENSFLKSVGNLFKSNSNQTVNSSNKIQEGFSQLNDYQALDTGFFGSLFKK